jgi:hypothetical protein
MGTSHNTAESYSEEEVPQRYLGEFLFTQKTATFGQKTIQLSNVSKIQVRSFKETKKAVYRITDENLKQAWKLLGVSLILILVGKYWEMAGTLGIILGVLGGGVIWYYYNERRRLKDKTYNYFGLFFDCTSGKTEVLWSHRQDFIVQLFDRISNSMNYERMSNFVAHFNDNSVLIQDSENIIVKSNIQAGEMVVGNGNYLT